MTRDTLRTLSHGPAGVISDACGSEYRALLVVSVVALHRRSQLLIDEAQRAVVGATFTEPDV